MRKKNNMCAERQLCMEKILFFHIEDMEAVRKIAGPLRIRVKEIRTEELSQPLGKLAGAYTGESAAPFTGTAPKESLFVFCGLSEKHLDRVLSALEQKELKIDYKAVLTETNRQWSVLRLFMELAKEKGAIERRNRG